VQEARKHLSLLFPDCGYDDAVVEKILKELELRDSMTASSMKPVGVSEPFPKVLQPPKLHPNKVNEWY
jgi:hypothetical protein